MSMIGYFLAVADSKINELMSDPERSPDFVMSSLQGEDEAETPLDIDKAWGGIHFMLTGEEWGGSPPLNFILAGDPVGDVDVGYGPARALKSPAVRAIAEALKDVSDEKLHARFDVKKMTEANIYPGIWDEGEEAFDYCRSHFARLKNYVLQAAAKENGMLLWMG